MFLCLVVRDIARFFFLKFTEMRDSHSVIGGSWKAKRGLGSVIGGLVLAFLYCNCRSEYLMSWMFACI